MKYHIWTSGCQMNVADSQRVASSLEKIGYAPTASIELADVVVLNTCVVRQSAEDKAHGRLSSLRPLKEDRPDMVINLMGCMVGVNGSEKLHQAYPFVDVFSPPSDPEPLISLLLEANEKEIDVRETKLRHALMDESLVLPKDEQSKLVSAYIPVVYGCSHACSFCVIPFRRGIERSRAVGEIAGEVRSLLEQGVMEITLLGQIVDRYGMDISDGPNLADLLRVLHEYPELKRIRFLTSHPNWMTDELLETVAELPKVCEHIEVPVQAGDDEVLRNMKRGYSVEDYRRLIDRIRSKIPNVSIATDIIVGFPGESDEKFQRTYELLDELQMDVAHLARYSPRPQTVSSRKMIDDVPEQEKMRRFRALEELQAGIATKINTRFAGQVEEILVEEEHKGRWKGRTRTNKLVFFESATDYWGQLANVEIAWTGPWSMRGVLHKPTP
ncbi:MAG: tRNA (N6-isopentenyl adenosine(37)-C2)-methylthiotransferase MiaB [Anaerolineales bacterium]